MQLAAFGEQTAQQQTADGHDDSCDMLLTAITILDSAQKYKKTCDSQVLHAGNDSTMTLLRDSNSSSSSTDSSQHTLTQHSCLQCMRPACKRRA
jgi:hypothetical protein